MNEPSPVIVDEVAEVATKRMQARLELAMMEAMLQGQAAPPRQYYMRLVVDPEVKKAQAKRDKKKKKARIQAKNSRRKNR